MSALLAVQVQASRLPELGQALKQTGRPGSTAEFCCPFCGKRGRAEYETDGKVTVACATPDCVSIRV